MLKERKVIGNMKKIFIVILVLFIFTVCYITVSDPVFDIQNYIPGTVVRYSEERPFNYPPAKWVSESPTVYFIVSEDDYKKSSSVEKYLDGQLNLEEQSIELRVRFNPACWVYFEDKNKIVKFDGQCKFKPDQLIVKIDKKTDKLFGGKYKYIMFKRMPNN